MSEGDPNLASPSPKRRRRGAGEGSVYQRKDGRWVGVVDLGWHDGARRRKSVYGETRSEALSKKRAEERRLEEGVNIGAKRERVDVFLQRWLADTEDHVAPKTIAQYRTLVRVHVAPVLGRHWVDKLTTAQVSLWLRGKREGGLSPKTCNHLRSTLRAALNQAVREGTIARNPVSATKPVAGESREVKPLTLEEVHRLREVIAGQPNEALYRMMLGLGLRIGEALALRWQEIDLEGAQPWAIGRPCLRIEWTLQRVAVGDQPSALVLKRPKTQKSRRVLPLPPPLVSLLRDHRQAQRKQRIARANLWQDEGFVFTSSIGTAIDPRNALREWKTAAVAAGIQLRTDASGASTSDARLHDLRHSAATALLAEGVPMKVVSELLGHSQMSTTADLYGHVLSETLADATERLSAAWERRDGPGKAVPNG